MQVLYRLTQIPSFKMDEQATPLSKVKSTEKLRP